MSKFSSFINEAFDHVDAASQAELKHVITFGACIIADAEEVIDGQTDLAKLREQVKTTCEVMLSTWPGHWESPE